MLGIGTTDKSTYKTKILDREIKAFLKSRYGDIANLYDLGGGEISQAFSFDAVDGGYVIRVNMHGSEGFDKDKHAFLRFSSEKLPIPKVVEVGTMDRIYSFILSKRIDALSVKDFIKADEEKKKGPKADIPELLNQCFATLDEIHAIDISNTTGYGYWTAKDPNGQKSSWKEFILSIGKDGWWADMFKSTFLEEGVYDSLYGKLSQLVEFCPEERHLIHGDFGFDNILTDGKKIVGVIDWAESKYGDYLYDVAWLSFWPTDFLVKKRCDDYYSKKVYMNYKQRILCYQLHIAINALSFFAQSMQKEKYEWTKNRINDLMKKGA